MSELQLHTPIEFLNGVGPQRAEMLREELRIARIADLLYFFPFRYEDRTRIDTIQNASRLRDNYQFKGHFIDIHTKKVGKRKKQLHARFSDGTGEIQIIWFQGQDWVFRQINQEEEFVIYGKLTNYKGSLNIAHPEVKKATEFLKEHQTSFHPVYSTTDKLRKNYLDSRGIARLTKRLVENIQGAIRETLPEHLLNRYRLVNRAEALCDMHHPRDAEALRQARRRLKFEELFFTQYLNLETKFKRHSESKGWIFAEVGDLVNQFYAENLPFELTGAQKRVIKEIRHDMNTGHHMNRLLQGDVGSGKTLVALMCMLVACDNQAQACLMAPTELLATQHFHSITDLLGGLEVKVALLTGSTKRAQRKEILESASNGELSILIGTHALIEPVVRFKNLGLAVIDEQQRFGVAQRAGLYTKNNPSPHILVMTATPIPRTLQMSVFGELDVSVIDELPIGRKQVQTIHKRESHRLSVLGFMRKLIEDGRQIYVVYPLIEESSKLDLLNLKKGFEYLETEFPRPKYQISIVHGQMDTEAREVEMKRFVNGETQIMVATTVIEVGVNVPNACLMIIENSERFGLSQLHQLRGRVGRGTEQAYCILMSKEKLSVEARKRINVMCSTNDGFRISQVDLELRGPGEISGLAQSGQIEYMVADLVEDGAVLAEANKVIWEILNKDPMLDLEENRVLRRSIAELRTEHKDWSKIS